MTSNLPFDELPNLVSSLVSEVNGLKSLLLKKEQPRKVDSKIPISINEACKLLNLSKSTLYGYCQQSLIPQYKQSKKLYFYKSELLEWINNGKVKTINELRDELKNNQKNENN